MDFENADFKKKSKEISLDQTKGYKLIFKFLDKSISDTLSIRFFGRKMIENGKCS